MIIQKINIKLYILLFLFTFITSCSENSEKLAKRKSSFNKTKDEEFYIKLTRKYSVKKPEIYDKSFVGLVFEKYDIGVKSIEEFMIFIKYIFSKYGEEELIKSLINAKKFGNKQPNFLIDMLNNYISLHYKFETKTFEERHKILKSLLYDIAIDNHIEI